MPDSGYDRTACDTCVSRRGFLGRVVALQAGWALLVDQALGAPVAGTEIRPILPLAWEGRERRYPIPAADGVSFDQASQVILVRRDGRVMAFNLACPHENAALRWRRKDDRFQCPRHESRYRPDGTFIDGRATRNMDRLPIRRDGDQLVVNLGYMIRSDEQPADWAAASVEVGNG